MRFTRQIALLGTVVILMLMSVGVWAQEVHEAGTHAETVVEHVTDHTADHAGDDHAMDIHHDEHPVPSIFAVVPFVAILLCIALLPLFHRTEHWWENNKHKLQVAVFLAAITTIYYFFRDFGFHGTDLGIPTVLGVYKHAIVADYIPFIVLLFSLYTISGGINLRGDLPAHPLTNTTILAIGTAIASFIGTTGAAMLLIRPLLQINSERKHVKHTVIFFIFLVANIGGCLLPIGDPPLFLGYLRGVPFLWTFHLWFEWLICAIAVLSVYFVWDTIAYRKENKDDILIDEMHREKLQIRGLVNFPLLVGVVLAVAFLVPGKELFGMKVPMFLREAVQIALAGVSWMVTSKAIRRANSFNFVAIGEVGALFIGIFITMMPAIEILNAKGASLGLSEPWHFFWATGLLSSFLDNAPTYVVFFETAGTLPVADPSSAMTGLQTVTGMIDWHILVAISCGAVFMGACTYIGNGPNFMVKSIAEQSGVKMPSFFGYMIYSFAVLFPLYVALTFIFF